MRIVVIADTHLHRGRHGRQVPPAAWAIIETADVIIHGGDIMDPTHLAELRHHAPVHAVLGNNDHELMGVLPVTLELDLDGVRIGVIHDGGRSEGRARRLRDRFPTCDVVVFAHSHMPLDEAGVDGQRLFNPGSPTERRRAPHHTIGVLEVTDGRLTRHEVVVVDQVAT